MYCKYCGNPVDRSTMSCSACGKPVGPLAGGVGLRDLLSGGSRAAADNVIPASQTPLAPAAPSPEVKRELARLSAELQEVRESIPQKKSGVSPILTGLCAAALLLSLVSLIVAFLPRGGVNALQLKELGNMAERIDALEKRLPEQEAQEETPAPTPTPEQTPTPAPTPEQTPTPAPTPEQPAYEESETGSEEAATDHGETVTESEEAATPTPDPSATQTAANAPAPIIDHHPSSETITSGARRAKVFQCKAISEYPVNYVWEFSRDGSEPWEELTESEKYSITLENGMSCLYVMNVGKEHAGIYRCVVTDANNNKAISNVATLTVTGNDASGTGTAAQNNGEDNIGIINKLFPASKRRIRRPF